MLFFKKSLIFCLIMICTLSLEAGELYLKENNQVRQFVTVERSLGAYVVREFIQEFGELPGLVEKQSLSDRKSYDAYLEKKYKNFKKIEDTQLKAWHRSSAESDLPEPFANMTPKFWGFKKNKNIWYAQNQWNEEWENKFSTWMSEEVDEDFFLRFNIPTDCADAVVGLRWIFARINSLPVANNMMGGGLFGNFSMRKEWNKYSTAKNWYDDNLFMAALYYVMDMTSTRTIDSDGFPIKLNKESIKPGVFITSQNEGGGHVKIISQTNFDKITELPIYTLASTLPRKLRTLQKEVMLDQDWPELGNKDILAFKWAVVINGEWKLDPSLSRSSYSQEQYNLELKVKNPIFIEYILTKIKGHHDPQTMLQVSAKDIAQYIKQRVEIVKLGYEKCLKIDCALGSAGDNDWGTLSRDKKLIQKYYDTEKLVEEFGRTHPNLLEQWQRLLNDTTVEVLGREINLNAIRFIFDKKLHSSLATVTPEERWGLAIKKEVDQIYNDIEEGLKNRNAVIEKDSSSCLVDCSPRSAGWLGLNTYHEDKKLNDQFVMLKTYCELLNSKACYDYTSLNQKSLTFNAQTKKLSDWIEVIPFFHSDPRVSKERRWGEIDPAINKIVLPIHNTIVVAKNDIALLDSHHLMNLKTGESIYKSEVRSHLFLDEDGSLIEINPISKKIQLLNSPKAHWIQIESSLDFIQENEKFIYFDEYSKILMGEKLNKKSFYELKDNKLLSLAQDVLNYETYKEFLILKKKDGLIILSQKNPSERYEFDHLNVKDIQSLKIKTITQGQAYFSYEDRDNDIYKAFGLTLISGELRSLVNNEKNYLVHHIDPINQRLILEEDFNREYGKIYLQTWGHNETRQMLENAIRGSYTQGEYTYFISVLGGKWDQYPVKTLYVWGPNGIEKVQELAEFSPTSIIDSRLQLDKDFKGRLIYLKDMSFSYIPGNIEINSNCSQFIGSQKTLSFNYNYMYGDYKCMGGVMLENNSPGPSIAYISLSSWKNAEDFIEKLWLFQYKNSKAYKGSIVTIGKNVSYWIDI